VRDRKDVYKALDSLDVKLATAVMELMEDLGRRDKPSPLT